MKMNSYCEFAGVYDRLMDDFDYPQWADYYLRLLDIAGCSPKKICDCACGTGSMSIELSKRGLSVTGVDLSPDMLEIAAQKARRNAQKILFACQDMTKLALPRPVDAIICACDGVNYLLSADYLRAFFRAARDNLKPHGCLAFDISSRHKLEDIIANGFFGEERDDVAYLWSNAFEADRHIVDMDLTFFKRLEGDTYRRFAEKHRQRAHSIDEIKLALAESGFSDIRVYGNMTLDAPRADEERIHFSAVAHKNN